MPFRNLAFSVAAIFLFSASMARAATIDVRVEGVKFIPDIVHAQVGDTIAFRSMPTHFVESVEGLWPEGAPPMQSRFGADYDYRVEKEGLYVFKCPPHWGGRMGGVLVVGNPANIGPSVASYLSVADMVKDAKPAKPLLNRLLERMAARH